MTTTREKVDAVIRAISEMLLAMGAPDEEVEYVANMLEAGDEVMLNSTYIVKAVAPDGTAFRRLATLDAESHGSLVKEIREMGGQLWAISLRDLAQNEWDLRWRNLCGPGTTIH